MKNLSIAYLVSAGVSAAIAASCFYLVSLASAAHAAGSWTFAGFGLLFSLLPLSALVRMLASRSELFARVDRALSPGAPETRTPRFAPHRAMLLAMLVLALIIMSVVISVTRDLLH